MIRQAAVEERPELEGEVWFIVDDGQIRGRVGVSRIPGKDGPQCWIHDLETEAHAPELMARARGQAKEWGFEEVWANVSNAKLAKVLMGHGWTPQQVILKGRTTHGN